MSNGILVICETEHPKNIALDSDHVLSRTLGKRCYVNGNGPCGAEL